MVRKIHSLCSSLSAASMRITMSIFYMASSMQACPDTVCHSVPEIIFWRFGMTSTSDVVDLSADGCLADTDFFDLMAAIFSSNSLSTAAAAASTPPRALVRPTGSADSTRLTCSHSLWLVTAVSFSCTVDDGFCLTPVRCRRHARLQL